MPRKAIIFAAMDEEEYPKVYLYRRVVQARLYIERHYADETGLELISGKAAFSKFHFIRLFKKIYGLTPHQYLRRVRIEKAKLLLLKNIPVNEVCPAVGFESVSSFILLFRQLTGQTPAAWQRQQLQNELNMKQQPLTYIPGCFALKRCETGDI